MDHFVTELSSFFKWLIGSTMHVSVLICLILAIKALIRHRLAVRWHYWLWLLLLARMLMPWAPQSSFSVFTLISQAKRSIVTEHITKVTPSAPIVDVTAKVTQDITPEATAPPEGEDQVSFAGTTPQTAQTPAGVASLEIIGILSLLWLVVALALAIAALACNFRLWRIIRSQRPLTEGKTLDALEDCKAEMGIQTIVGVIVTDKVKSPALFGVVRPRLLLPEGIIETLTQEELRYVFLHELAHLKRRDIYLGWLMVILQVLHWFNPLVWLAFGRMRADRELACDGLVLSTIHAGESERYGTTIVNLFRTLSGVQYVPGIAGILEDKSQVKRRITMIARFKKGSYRWSTMAVVLLTILGCVFLTNARGVSQAENREPEVMAEEFVELLVKGQFAKAVEGFNAAMKESLPTDELAQTWRTTTGQAGLFKQQLGTRWEKFLGSEIVFVTCEFEKGPMDVKVVFDSDSKVTGLWFLPTPQKVLDEHRGRAVGEVNSGAGEKSDGPQWVSSDWQGASKGEYALKFNGSSNYVKIPSSPSLDIRGSLTLSAWVKNDGDNDGQIIWRGDNQVGKDPYMIHVANNRMEFRLNPLEGNLTYTGTAKSRETLDNNWHLWTATYDSKAKTMYLYKDGQLESLESTAEAPAGLKYDTSKMWNTIGAVDFGNWQHFKGAIDEVRIWNRSLTPQEIQQAADGIYKANDPNLVAHWNFNEGEGNTIHDISPSNNLGQLHTWTGRTGYISPRRRQPPPAVAPGQSAPVVVETSPQAFANNVSPRLTSISVTFDQPMMDGSWSWTGGGDTYPKMAGRPYYDQSKRICTMPVTLEPGKVYWVGINSPSHKNFKTPSRRAAPWYIILFATRSADGKPTPIPDKMLARARQINSAAGHLAPATLRPKTTPDGKLVIPSQRPWTDTGIDVKAGQEIRLLATGTIHGCRGPKQDWAYGPWGPDGKLFEQGHVAAAGKRLFALIGRIGDREFHVGSKATITAPVDGRLYLGVSDSYHSDNVGAFTVKVELSPATQPRATD